jgi:hypothetical protein
MNVICLCFICNWCYLPHQFCIEYVYVALLQVYYRNWKQFGSDNCPIIYLRDRPPSKRGLLNTFPQFSGSGEMFLSYYINFIIYQMLNPDWRTMFTVQAIHSVMYRLLILFYLPKSLKWFVSRRRVDKSIKVLQSL